MFVVAQGVDGGKVPFWQGTHGGKRRTPKTGEREKVPETRGLNARRPMWVHRPSLFTGGQSLFATVRKGSPKRTCFRELLVRQSETSASTATTYVIYVWGGLMAGCNYPREPIDARVNSWFAIVAESLLR